MPSVEDTFDSESAPSAQAPSSPEDSASHREAALAHSGTLRMLASPARLSHRRSSRRLYQDSPCGSFGPAGPGGSQSSTGGLSADPLAEVPAEPVGSGVPAPPGLKPAQPARSSARARAPLDARSIRASPPLR